MPTQRELDKLYMDFAFRVAKMSKAIRRKVGAVLVKNNAVISYGYNGTPSGDDNTCEIKNEDGKLITKESVIHAEMNAILKPLNGGISTEGSIMYITDAPCIHCAKHLAQFKIIDALVYARIYKNDEGANHLLSKGVDVRQIPKQIQIETQPYEFPEHDGYMEVETTNIKKSDDFTMFVDKGQIWESLHKNLSKNISKCQVLKPINSPKSLPSYKEDHICVVVSNGEFRRRTTPCFYMSYKNMWYIFPFPISD